MREIKFNPIRSIERSIDVLQAFTTVNEKLTLEEVVEYTGIPRSTVYRILCTLESRRMVEFDEKEQNYKPGLKLIEMGVFLSYSLDVYQEAEDILLRLQADTKQSIVMALGDEEDIIYVFIKENSEGLKFSSVVGQRRPYVYGVLGYTLLAFEETDKVERILDKDIPKRTKYTVTEKEKVMRRLEDIRSKGLFTEKDETTIGVTGVGAPIFNQKGQPEAAVGIVGPSVQLKGPELAKAENLLLKATQEISVRMGYKGKYFKEKKDSLLLSREDRS